MKTETKGQINILAEIEVQREAVSQARERTEDLRTRLKKEESLLTGMETELATLEAAWAFLERKQGGSVAETRTARSAPAVVQTFVVEPLKQPSNSVVGIAEVVLNDVGHPLTINQLYERVVVKQKEQNSPVVSKNGMSGVLYRWANRRRRFVKVGPGVIGLKAWITERGMH